MTVESSTLRDGPGLMELTGAFLGGEEIDELRDAFSRFVEDGPEHLLVDATGVTFLNSAAVGVLVAAHISFTRRHRRLVLCGAKNAVYSMLAMTKLNLVLVTRDTRAEGIRACTE
jgi:anti-anti-sigma factor